MNRTEQNDSAAFVQCPACGECYYERELDGLQEFYCSSLVDGAACALALNVADAIDPSAPEAAQEAI